MKDLEEDPPMLKACLAAVTAFIALWNAATNQSAHAATSPRCAQAPTSSQIANVKNYGAKGNGVTDDTAAIQKAINQISGTGGTVQVPDGTYMINALAIPYAGAHGLEIDGAMTLSLSSNATLQAIRNSADSYKIIMVYPGATNVNIVGGTIRGERQTHQGARGEWGTGISIEGAQRIVVENVNSNENWGDGFYVTGGSKQVKLCNVTANHNRRQGLSIIDVDGMLVKSSLFQNTAGTPPEAGIDIEPNRGNHVNNVQIITSRFFNNAGGGFMSGVPVANTGVSTVTNVVFNQNDVENNGVNPMSGGYSTAINITNSNGQQVINNIVKNNTGQGIMAHLNATGTLISGNTVTGTRTAGFSRSSGIYLEECARSIVTNNTVTDNGGYGIFNQLSDSSIKISNNQVFGNGKTP